MADDDPQDENSEGDSSGIGQRSAPGGVGETNGDSNRRSPGRGRNSRHVVEGYR